MIILGLFDTPDYTLTAKCVHQFLQTQLPRLALMCGRHLTDLSSPQLSLAPGGGSHGNTAENNIVNALEAESVVQAIHYCIYVLPATSRAILIYRYVDQLSDLNAQYRLRYSERQYLRLKRRALNGFADAYESAQRHYNISSDNIVDLHRF